VNNSLNLASKPFSNRILPWALSAIILFVSLIGLILVVKLTTTAKKDADRAQLEINALKQQEHALLEAAKSAKASYSGDQQQALPSAHQLVDRKGFSWSGLLADLEASLPNNVKVSRISVQDVTKDAQQTVAQLDLALFSEDASTINSMIAAMHQQGIFQLELRNQNLNKGRGEKGTEYEFFVIYRARPGYSIERVAEVGGAGSTAASTGEVRR
jgi:Tfp pilus assembly protein PilN